MDSIETRRVAGLWYAWGRIDSGQHPHMNNLDHGFEFARWQEGKAKDYYQGRRGFLPSLLGDWADFVETAKRPKVSLVKASTTAKSVPVLSVADRTGEDGLLYTFEDEA